MKKSNNKSTDDLLAECEVVGTVGSPSSTHSINMIIREIAERRKLRGQYVCLKVPQDDTTSYVLGHITEVEMCNPQLEDVGWMDALKKKGQLDVLTEKLDFLKAGLRPRTVFTEDEYGGFTVDMLGTPPRTGTPIYIATNSIIERFTSEHEDENFFMGYLYNSPTRLPLMLQHFDEGEGGAADAYHIVVAGPSGSGKSTQAKMITAAYARYAQMCIFMIDQVGEFARNARGEFGKEVFKLNLKKVFEKLNKPVKIIDAHQLRLDRWEIFEKLLSKSELMRRILATSGPNLKIAIEILKAELKRKVTLNHLHERSSFELALKILGEDEFKEQIYKSRGARDGFAKRLDANPEDIYPLWQKITHPFRGDRPGTITVDDLLNKVVFNKDSPDRPVVIVDVSEARNKPVMSSEDISFWDDTIQAVIIKRLLNGIKEKGFDAWQNKGESLNTLVVVDEAQRLIGEGDFEENEDLKEVSKTLIDAADTTRKYGLGWMFVGTSLSSVDRRIARNVRVWVLGAGFTHGRELERMKELLPDADDLQLYLSFRDPNSSMNQNSKQFSFVLKGPISRLGQPLFMTAFTNKDEFLQRNNLTDIATTQSIKQPTTRTGHYI